MKRPRRSPKHRKLSEITPDPLKATGSESQRFDISEWYSKILYKGKDVRITSKNVRAPSDLVFDIDSVAGQGAYGSVYKAVNMHTGRIIALKELKALEKPDAGITQVIIREIQILSKLKHRNIAGLDEIVRLDKRIYMAFEFVENDLAALLRSDAVSLTLPMVRSFIRQLTEALSYIHERNIVHRDIKSANILVSRSGVVKLADFGLARYLPANRKESMTNRVVTVCYRPPELILGAVKYGPSIDMWCLGCLVFELLQRKTLFNSANEVLQYEAIVGFLGTPTVTTWPDMFELPWYPMLCFIDCREPTGERAFASLPTELGDIARQLLQWNPDLRATAQYLLDNEFQYPIWHEEVEITDLGERQRTIA